MSDAAEIGPNIRRRRKGLGLSLEALASRSGVSATMLSEVERSAKNPTVKLAYQIARALGCSLTDLLEQPNRPALQVTAATDRVRLADPESGVVRHGLHAGQLGLELAWYALPANSSTGQMAANRQGVVELITVLEGTLTFVLGEDRQTLEPGDTATYAPTVTTEYRNEARKKKCRFLLLSDATKAQ
ncbi:MAG: XRE family transcriptional regulator [Myxococcota bacterium]